MIMTTKLRASCDPCHFAKIKCKKSDQGCQRCASLGQQCFYSPALPRACYKKRSRELDSTISQPTVPSAGGPSILVGRTGSTDPSTRLSLSKSTNNAGTPREALTSTSSTNINTHAHDGAASGPSDFYWPFAPEESALGNYACEPVPLAPDPWGFPGNPSSLTGVITPNSLANIVSSRSSLHSPPLSTTRQTKTSNELDTCHPHSSASWSLQSPSTLDPCNCFLGLLTATQSISGQASLSNAALDSVLCANRATTKHCIASLKCTYSIDSTDNISCTAISCGLLDRVLASYHAALNSFCASLEREELDTQDQNEDDSEDRTARAGDVRVRLGAFAVENSEQVLCARRIVTGEIEKLRAAVEGCPNNGGNIRSVLIEHVIKRCTSVINTIAS